MLSVQHAGVQERGEVGRDSESANDSDGRATLRPPSLIVTLTLAE